MECGGEPCGDKDLKTDSLNILECYLPVCYEQ